jgi:hypothetical protein
MDIMKEQDVLLWFPESKLNQLLFLLTLKTGNSIKVVSTLIVPILQTTLSWLLDMIMMEIGLSEIPGGKIGANKATWLSKLETHALFVPNLQMLFDFGSSLSF